MRWKVALVFLFFGIVTIEPDSLPWSTLTLFLYLLPLACQPVRWEVVRYGSLWLGVFLVGQTLLSLFFIDPDYRTLTPNLAVTIDVKGGLPGIEGRQLITTDQNGYRASKGVDSGPQTYKIFAIGGSTTEQIYLDDRKTWTHLLRKALDSRFSQQVQVINTGVAGLRAKNHLATLKHILPYQPDMVLFLLGLNDWNHHIRARFREGPSIPSSISRLQLRKTLLGSVIKTAGHALLAAVGSLQEAKVAVTYGEYYEKKRGSLGRKKRISFRPGEVHSEYKKTLVEISSVCHDNQIECVFVTQPTAYQPQATAAFRAGFWMTPPNEEYTLDFDSMVHIASLYNRFLREFAVGREHTVCDLAQEFDRPDTLFYDDCHFNEKGAVKAADLLFRCLSGLLNETTPIQSCCSDLPMSHASSFNDHASLRGHRRSGRRIVRWPFIPLPRD